MGKLQDIGFERTRSCSVEHERDSCQLHVCRKHNSLDRAVWEPMFQEKYARGFVRVGIDEAVLILWGRVNDPSPDTGLEELTVPRNIIQIGVELCP